MNGKEKRQIYRKTISYWIFAIGGIAMALGSFLIQNERKRAAVDIIVLLGFVYVSYKSDRTRRSKGILIGFWLISLIGIAVCAFLL